MHESRRSTLMAFDYGVRKIGVAVGNTLTGTVSGIASVRADDDTTRQAAIEALIREWRPDALVVGLPLDAAGGVTASSREARKFGEDLGKRAALPVYWVNEHLTSQAAQTILKETLEPGKRFSRRKQSGRDLLAAEFILRSYLESLATRG